MQLAFVRPSLEGYRLRRDVSGAIPLFSDTCELDSGIFAAQTRVRESVTRRSVIGLGASMSGVVATVACTTNGSLLTHH